MATPLAVASLSDQGIFDSDSQPQLPPNVARVFRQVKRKHGLLRRTLAASQVLIESAESLCNAEEDFQISVGGEVAEFPVSVSRPVAPPTHGGSDSCRPHTARSGNACRSAGTPLRSVATERLGRLWTAGDCDEELRVVVRLSEHSARQGDLLRRAFAGNDGLTADVEELLQVLDRGSDGGGYGTDGPLWAGPPTVVEIGERHGALSGLGRGFERCGKFCEAGDGPKGGLAFAGGARGVESAGGGLASAGGPSSGCLGNCWELESGGECGTEIGREVPLPNFSPTASSDCTTLIHLLAG
eukprot:evm.model.scf_2263.2 EVM.evm.TU.scf_2263.2   scf_2263:21926-22933(-)